MPKKEKISISDAQLKNELIKLFEKGNTDKGKCREVLGSRYKLQVQRFYNLFNYTIKDCAKTKENATNEQIDANQKESLKRGLKSKIQIQLEIQKEIEQLQKILADGYLVKKVTFADGKTESKREVFGTKEIESYHRMIDSKRTELIKLEGMYAPTKTAATDKDGNNLQTPASLKDLSVDDIKALLKS